MPKARAANPSTSLDLWNPKPRPDQHKNRCAYQWKINGPSHTTFLGRWKFTTLGGDLRVRRILKPTRVPRWSGVLLSCLIQATLHRLPEELPRNGTLIIDLITPRLMGEHLKGVTQSPLHRLAQSDRYPGAPPGLITIPIVIMARLGETMVEHPRRIRPDIRPWIFRIRMGENPAQNYLYRLRFAVCGHLTLMARP